MAKLFLDAGDKVNVSNAMTVYGSTGTEYAIISSGTTGVVVDQNIERVDLPGASSAFTYQQAGNQMNVYSGATLVATVPLQGDTNGTQLVFTNGSANATLVSGAMTLGGAAVTTTTAAATPTTIDAATTSTSTGVTTATPVPTFTVTGATAAAEATTASFVVSLANRAAGVAYGTTVTLAGTGGATAGTDFTNALTLDAASTAAGITFTGGVLTIPASSTVSSVTLTTAVTADTLTPETGEGLSVTLSAPTGTSAVIGTASSVTTAITDVPVTYTMTSSAANVYEGAAITYTLTASANASADTTVAFSVVPGDTAAADQGTSNTNLNDFAAGAFNPSNVTMTAGTNTATYTVTSATDTKTELPENYSVKAVIGTTTVGTTTTSLLDGTGENIGKTIALTTGIDTGASFTGAGANDTFNATTGTNQLSALDSLDGGDGTDTINITQTAAVDIPTNATVKNIEIANITSGAALGNTGADLSGWTGLTTVTATSTTTASNVTGANQSIKGGAANVTWTTSEGITGLAADKSTGTLTSTGGKAVVVNRTLTNDTVNMTVTGGAITQTGTASTTSVSVSQSATVAEAAAVAGITSGTVTINDANAASATKAATISSVTLANYDASTISSNALKTLSLSGTAGTLGITTGLTTPTNTTLDLTVNGLSAPAALGSSNTITDSTAPTGLGFTTLNITTTTADSTISNIAAVDVTSLTVAGTKALTFTSTAGMTTLSTVSVSGSAGLTAALNGSTVTAINASGTSGAMTVTVDGTKATYTGGSGVDTVTVVATPTKAITGGTGTDDVLVLNGAAATAQVGTLATGFEVLSLGTAATGSYDATGFTRLLEAGTLTGGVTFTGVANNSTLTISAAPGQTTTITGANVGGGTDTFNLVVSAAATIAANTVAAAGFETVNLTSTDTTTAFDAVHTLTLQATSATAITVAGNAGLNLTNTGNTAVTSFSAASNTATGVGVTFTSANITGNATIIGGAGSDTLNAAASISTKVASMDGGAGTDFITGGAGSDVINGGTGDDIITGGAKGDNLTGGTGADFFVVTAPTESNGTSVDTIVDFVTGTDKIVIPATTATFTYSGTASGYGAVLTSLLTTKSVGVLDTSTSTLYIDVDADAALTVADIAFQMTGVTTLAQGDFMAGAFLNGTIASDAALTGTAAVDVIFGLDGADTITGAAGADVLSGGGGADTFVIGAAESLNTALDTILDYTAGTDLLDLAHIPVSLAASAGKDFSTAVAVASTGTTAATLLTNLQTAATAQQVSAGLWAQAGDTIAVTITGASIAGTNVTYIIQNQAADNTVDAAADTVIALIGTSTAPTALASFV